jgi:hypothetical protein
MNNEQMQMLSVKSALERTIQAFSAARAACDGTTSEHRFHCLLEDVEKYVAALFASNQIDRDFTVNSSMTLGYIEVRFSTQGHQSTLTVMLPASLRSKEAAWPFPISARHAEMEFVSNVPSVEEAVPYPDAMYVPFDDYQDAVTEYHSQLNLIKEQMMTDDDAAAQAYERAKKFVA